MAEMKIKVCGPRGSGKSTLMAHIMHMLDHLDISYQTEIYEDVDTENISVSLSRHDLEFLRGDINLLRGTK